MPRFSTQRTASRTTRGHELAAIAELLGTPLMPWQRHVADIGLELLPNGLPAYKYVVVTVPRQNGKTTLLLAWELFRLVSWNPGSIQTVVYSAADGNAAGKKLIKDQVPLIERSPFMAVVNKFRYAAGLQGIDVKGGSRLDVLGQSPSAGRGMTVGLAVLDEIQEDKDDRRQLALVPTMRTVPDSQFLAVGTAGDEDSVLLKHFRDQGIAAVEADQRQGIAFFEWSADPEAEPSDPDTWRSCTPAMGYTVSEDSMAGDFAVTKLHTFKQEFLNIQCDSSERVIPRETWEAVCSDDTPAPNAGICFGVDINPQHTFASVAAVDQDGNAEALAYKAGTSWVHDYLVTAAKNTNAPVAINTAGPAGFLVHDLENSDVKVIKVDGNEFTNSCASILTAIADKTIKVRTNAVFEHLDLAVDAARKRPVGDAWAWTRKASSADISPLVALTVAHWGAVVAPLPRTYRFLTLNDAGDGFRDDN